MNKNAQKHMKKIISTLMLLITCLTGFAQSLAPNTVPSVIYYSREEGKDVEITAGDAFTEEAPLTLQCRANVTANDGTEFLYEWQLRKIVNGKAEMILRRDEENPVLNILESGVYNLKFMLTYTFGGVRIDMNDIDSISFTVPESTLSCPDGFSPNDDGKNDYLRINVKSIVRLNAAIFNRWGQKVASTDLDKAVAHEHSEQNKLVVWDGMIGGKYAKDGVYFLNLVAQGSDGQEYKIKKAINVLKGFKKNDETDGKNSDY